MTLREWTVEDSQTLFGWLEQEPDLWTKVGWPYAPSLAMVEITSLLMLQHKREGHAINKAVLDDGGKVIGLIQADPILWDKKIAFVHIVTSPTVRGQGKEIAELGNEEARKLGLKTLIAAVRDDRKVRAFLRSVGYKPPVVELWELEL